MKQPVFIDLNYYSLMDLDLWNECLISLMIWLWQMKNLLALNVTFLSIRFTFTNPRIRNRRRYLRMIIMHTRIKMIHAMHSIKLYVYYTFFYYGCSKRRILYRSNLLRLPCQIFLGIHWKCLFGPNILHCLS